MVKVIGTIRLTKWMALLDSKPSARPAPVLLIQLPCVPVQLPALVGALQALVHGPSSSRAWLSGSCLSNFLPFVLAHACDLVLAIYMSHLCMQISLEKYNNTQLRVISLAFMVS